MAKPTIKFSAVAYELNKKTGYRPQLEAQDGKYDLDFCTEVVNDKRLAMSPDELLHALEMTGEVAAKKVAEDGRPRGITKLIKWNRFATGKLESPSSPWNNSCKAVIRPQLLAEATKIIDANFVNITSGIGVKLNNVTWIGAKDVTNVIKVGEFIGANGNHMEFNPELGDKASLTVGEVEYPLDYVESDVTRATFDYPEALEGVEPGTPAIFTMHSRGGIEGGQVYPTKKKVIILASTRPLKLSITKVTSTATGRDGEWKPFRDTSIIYGTCLDENVTATVRMIKSDGEPVELPLEDGNEVIHNEDGTLSLVIKANTSPMPDGGWTGRPTYIVVKRGDEEAMKEITPIA